MSFTITYDNQTKTFDNKVALLDLAGDDHSIVCAKVNNRIRELTYEVYFDAEVSFLTVKDQDAIRTYETSLRYLFAMAFTRLYPDVDFRFSYNVSRSIFVELLNRDKLSDTYMVRQLEREMQRIVDADYKFNRFIVSKDEARAIYEKLHMQDKIEILKFRPEKTVHFYECEGYLNYMFGYMVPSSGYLKSWKLRLYSPGILIQYPRYECRGEIPPFQDAPTFGHTLKAIHQWSKITHADSVAGINAYITDERVVEFINLSEALHNRMLAELGELITKDIDNIRLICIAGPSSSGKTTFANRLRIELLSRGINPIRISIDDYYLPRNKAPKDENGDADLESIDALDIEHFNQNMLDLIQGMAVELPKFDFKIGQRVSGRTLKIDHDTVIIIEGIHALNDKLTTLIPKHQKYKIYISPQSQINLDNHNPLSLTDLRLLRRIVRDKKYRNSSAEETISMWPSVRRGEFTWIYDTQENADYVFNSFLSYELCVMKRYAMPLLTTIEKDAPNYPTAERLIRMLKYFLDIEDRWVPSNSLIREFIGGSCYSDVI
ncbi:MAG TPA: AAA family ATPase [Firmicutes bacterium]|jgi:uridine kinase|nr:AAA family ATPase [Bacillota bacterium]